MAAVKFAWDKDRYKFSGLNFTSKTKKINQRDIYEALEHDYTGSLYIQFHEIFEDVPVWMYDGKGDDVWLYEACDEGLRFILTWMVQHDGWTEEDLRTELMNRVDYIFGKSR